MVPGAIRHLSRRTGAGIAWSATGEGRPVVAVPGLVSHLLLDWELPGTSAFYQALVDAGHRLIRYDRPGNGLGGRLGETDFSVDAQLADLLAVIEASGEARVDLVGRNLAGPLAIAFAAAHPRRVERLVLIDTAQRLVATPDFPEGADPRLGRLLRELCLTDWRLAARAIAEVMLGGESEEAAGRFADYLLRATSGEVTAGLLGLLLEVDVTSFCERVEAPVLVLHRRDDRAVSVAAARRLAAAIPGARLELLDGSATTPHFSDSRPLAAGVVSFLAARDAGFTLDRRPLSERELEVAHLGRPRPEEPGGGAAPGDRRADRGGARHHRPAQARPGVEGRAGRVDGQAFAAGGLTGR